MQQSRSEPLMSFYGKLSVERLENQNVIGIFIALPGFTPQADEYSSNLRDKDRKFKTILSEDIDQIARDLNLISNRQTHEYVASDRAIILTEHGVYSAEKILDNVTRLPIAIHVWTSHQDVSESVINLIRHSDYAANLPIVPLSRSGHQEYPSTPTINIAFVEVSAGSGDFDYQYPVAPAYFVGRQSIRDDFSAFIKSMVHGCHILVINGQSGWGKSSLALMMKDEILRAGSFALVLDTRTANSIDYVAQALRLFALKCSEHGLTISSSRPIIWEYCVCYPHPKPM